MGLAVSIIVLLCAAAGQPAPATELLTNAGFARGTQGYMLLHAVLDPTVRWQGAACVRLSGVKPGPGAWSHVGMAVPQPRADTELRFTCQVRGARAGQTAAVNAFAYGDRQDSLLGNWSTTVRLAPGKWVGVRATYVVPAGTRILTIWVINADARPLLVAGPHLLVGAPRKAAPPAAAGPARTLDGPGVIRVVVQAAVRTVAGETRGTVTFPIPGTYREQVPLTFTLTSTPPEALQGYRWRRREDGLNWVCEATVAPPPKGAILKWEALVLVDHRAPASLPAAEKPAAPAEAAPWLRSTACVQSADPAVRAKADELARGGGGVEAYARRAIGFTSTYQGKPGARFDALDARKALECGGSCTSRANLAAALLRARGIPARTVAHMPTWYPGKLYEHWLVEYWHPGAGWVWLESTRGQMQPSPSTLVVLNVANPDDEDRAFDPVHLRYVMPGAPYLSVCELSKELTAAPLFRDDAVNSGVVAGCADGTPEEVRALFAAAREAYGRLTADGEAGRIDASLAGRLKSALAAGRAAALRDAIAGR